MSKEEDSQLSRTIIKSMSWIQSRKEKIRQKRHEVGELQRIADLYKETKMALEEKTRQFAQLEWSIWSTSSNDVARRKMYSAENEKLKDQIRRLEEINWQYEVYIFNEAQKATEVSSDETQTDEESH